jgi:hypothetical protein
LLIRFWGTILAAGEILWWKKFQEKARNAGSFIDLSLTQQTT